MIMERYYRTKKKCRWNYMPKSIRKKVKRCVRKLLDKGYDQSAYPICINRIYKLKDNNIIPFSAII